MFDLIYFFHYQPEMEILSLDGPHSYFLIN